MSYRNSYLLLLCLVLCTACRGVGPDYRRPDLGLPSGYSVPGTVSDSEEAPLPHSPWWWALGDGNLNTLVSQALTNNFDVRIGLERLQRSRMARSQALSAGLPQVSAVPSFSKIRNSDNFLAPFTSSPQQGLIPNEFDQWTLGIPVSWELDVFGGVRRSVEAAGARILAAEAGLEGLRLSTSAEVADTYVSIIGLNRQQVLLEDSIQLQQQTLKLVKLRHDSGLASQLDVERSVSQLESIRAMLPPLQSAGVNELRRLTLLLGSESSAMDAQAESWTDFPEDLPFIQVGLPAQLIRRRPDIRVMESQLAASSAGIGVAISNFYPKFYLMGQPQLVSSSAVNLFEASSFAWQFAPRIEWALFAGGRNRAILEQARSENREALLAYEKAVIKAIGEVESGIAAMDAHRRRYQSWTEASRAAETAVSLSEKMYGAGRISLLDLLIDQLRRNEINLEMIQAKTALTRAWIRLHLTLGGGWGTGQYSDSDMDSDSR